MKNKRSYKVLWNVFLFVICGGSLIYGFVQQQRMIETKVQLDACHQKVDSLRAEAERLNNNLTATLNELQRVKNAAISDNYTNRK